MLINKIVVNIKLAIKMISSHKNHSKRCSKKLRIL